LLFSARTSSTGSPDRTVEFCHCGSVIVEAMMYFCTRLRESVMPVASLLCCGQ